MSITMPLAPVDTARLQIPDAEQVCAWLMENAGLKTVDLERARRLSQESAQQSQDNELLGLLTRLGLVSEFELARAWSALLDAPLVLAESAPPLLDPLPPLTERFMRQYQIVPLGWSDGGLRVLAANPPRTDARRVGHERNSMRTARRAPDHRNKNHDLIEGEQKRWVKPRTR